MAVMLIQCQGQAEQGEGLEWHGQDWGCSITS